MTATPTKIYNAKNLSLKEVKRLLGIQEKISVDGYADRLDLMPLSEREELELFQIVEDFRGYLNAEKVSEGLIKILTLYPLLKLAGFYHAPIELRVEESIAEIEIADEAAVIKGRFDLIALNDTESQTNQPFWVVVVEAKNSAIVPATGLPQLLAYALARLKSQPFEWGLLTCGSYSQFVYIEQSNRLQDQPVTYQLLPPLYLFERDRSVQLLQCLKAICQLQAASSL
jgi:hypothetical protein